MLAIVNTVKSYDFFFSFYLMVITEYSKFYFQTCSLGSSIVNVTLFHYFGLPEHTIPANAISMNDFIRRVRRSHPYSNADLMVVHCTLRQMIIANGTTHYINNFLYYVNKVTKSRSCASISNEQVCIKVLRVAEEYQ